MEDILSFLVEEVEVVEGTRTLEGMKKPRKDKEEVDVHTGLMQEEEEDKDEMVEEGSLMKQLDNRAEDEDMVLLLPPVVGILMLALNRLH